MQIRQLTPDGYFIIVVDANDCELIADGTADASTGNPNSSDYSHSGLLSRSFRAMAGVLQTNDRFKNI